MHQRDEEKNDQYYGNPHKKSGLGLREFVTADGTTLAVFRHIHRTIGAFFSLTPYQLCRLLSSHLSFSQKTEPSIHYIIAIVLLIMTGQTLPECFYSF